MDSPTFNLIPGKQGEQVKICAINAGALLDFTDYFPNDGRKFL
jgi:hypothetical protein